ncbi:tail fiber assembly protein [Pseudomonas alkylphenolica]|uniref:Phage tail fiber assembly protein n=1 Tax=Pseudomonas alkylphenolica TaxID=237609 RepID=A0A077F610_9PSED|nr:tail fiber assembly protein [Pseudomonas alkylphenolica]AIL60947.1 phage tail fiber assembly protein [Pseudomonas alkylphenolica]
MLIKLSPVSPLSPDATLVVSKQGEAITLNGTQFDFSRLENGATLPAEAVRSDWISKPVERIDGRLVLTLTLPCHDGAPESARFPVDIVSPADGPVRLPGIEPSTVPQSAAGVIDWSQVITREMKEQAATGRLLAAVVTEAAQRRAAADMAIAPLQDAVELGRADQAKQDLLRAWKNYRIDLGEIPQQAGYPTEIDWPAPPA